MDDQNPFVNPQPPTVPGNTQYAPQPQIPAAPQTTQPIQPYAPPTASVQPPKSGIKRVLVIVICLVVLAALGVAMYFVVLNKAKPAPANTVSTKPGTTEVKIHTFAEDYDLPADRYMDYITPPEGMTRDTTTVGRIKYAGSSQASFVRIATGSIATVYAHNSTRSDFCLGSVSRSTFTNRSIDKLEATRVGEPSVVVLSVAGANEQIEVLRGQYTYNGADGLHHGVVMCLMGPVHSVFAVYDAPDATWTAASMDDFTKAVSFKTD